MHGVIIEFNQIIKNNSMRKIFYKTIVLVFSFLMLSACRDDESSSTTPSIVGTWQPISLKVSGSQNGQNFSQTIAANQCQLQSRSTFQANGTGISKIWDDSNGTCTQSPDVNFTYTYNKDTKAITITADGNTQSGTVVALSNTQLVYQMPSTYDFNGVNAPATLEITAKRTN